MSRANERAIEAFKLRKKGMTLKAAGEALGVGPTQASSLAARGERIFRSAMMNPHMPVSGIEEFTYSDYKAAADKLRMERLEARVRMLERLLERNGIKIPPR